jgi:hypothetical protein
MNQELSSSNQQHSFHFLSKVVVFIIAENRSFIELLL